MSPLSFIKLIPAEFKNVYVSSIFSDELTQSLKFSGLGAQIFQTDKSSDFSFNNAIFVYLGVSFKTASYSENALRMISNSCSDILWSPCELDGSYENSFWPSDYSHIIESYFPKSKLQPQILTNRNFTLISPLLVSTTNLHSKHIEDVSLDLTTKNLDLLSRDAFVSLKQSIEDSSYVSNPPERFRKPIILTIAKFVWSFSKFILPSTVRSRMLLGVDNVVKFRVNKI